MRNLKEDTGKEIKRYSDVYSDERRNQGWWYFTTHGVQPGSVPKGVNILEVRDTPNGTYFRVDAILNTSELEYYDIKERVPKQEESLNKKPANTKINIRESLNKYDLRTDNKYDLRNLYDACIMTDKEKRIIAEMIAKNARANVLYEVLMNKFEGKPLVEGVKDIIVDDPELKRKIDVLYDNGFITKNQLIFGGVSEKDINKLYSDNFDDNGKQRRKSKYKKVKYGKGKNESLKEAIQPSHLKNLLVNFFNSNFGGYGDPDNKVLSVDDIVTDYRNRVIEIHTMTFEDSSSNFYKDYENYQEVDMDDLSAFLWGKASDADDQEESLKESKQNLTLLYKNMGGSIWKSTGKSGERELHIVDDKNGKCVKVIDGSKYSKKDYDDLIRQYVGGSKNESLKEGANDRLRQIAQPLANALDELTDRDDGFYITYSIGMDDNGAVTGGVDFELFKSSRTEEEAKAEIERVFDENGFELDRRYKTNPGKTLFGRTHYQIIERDTK